MNRRGFFGRAFGATAWLIVRRDSDGTIGVRVGQALESFNPKGSVVPQLRHVGDNDPQVARVCEHEWFEVVFANRVGPMAHQCHRCGTVVTFVP